MAHQKETCKRKVCTSLFIFREFFSCRASRSSGCGWNPAACGRPAYKLPVWCWAGRGPFRRPMWQHQCRGQGPLSWSLGGGLCPRCAGACQPASTALWAHGIKPLVPMAGSGRPLKQKKYRNCHQTSVCFEHGRGLFFCVQTLSWKKKAWYTECSNAEAVRDKIRS